MARWASPTEPFLGFKIHIALCAQTQIREYFESAALQRFQNILWFGFLS